MDLTKVLEMLGRKQVVLEAQDVAIHELFMLLALVQDGAIRPGRLRIDIEKRTWEVAPNMASPTDPAEVDRVLRNRDAEQE